MFEPEVDEAIKRFSTSLETAHPGFKSIIEDLKNGKIGEVEAMAALMNLATTQNLSDEITRVAEEAFGVVKQANTAIVGQNIDNPPPIVYRATGLPMLNPLVEAAIAERVQFDGDAPELRSGRLPEGGTPAVPVATEARSLVAIGVQLQQASGEVAAELRAEDTRFADQAAKVLGDASDPGTAIARGKEAGLMVPAGVPGYETGQVPALRSVASPTGSALAAMPVAEQQQAAWKALSTTQGRRSALGVLEELVLVGLASMGYEMQARPQGMVKDVPVYAQWTCRISGAESTQSNFSFIDIASKSILRQLGEQLAKVQVPDPVLEVFAVNTIDIREVGWGARVVSR
jgi:hypothetical protein